MACRQAASWPEPDGLCLIMAAHGIVTDRLLAEIAEALEQSGLEPGRLELALPEQALADGGIEMLFLLSALRDLGVGIAVDRFGAGLASLNMLRRMPLTAIRLDRALIRGLPRDPGDAAIVRAVAETGRALEMTVVATGVEEEAQRSFLAAIGCGQAQGPLFPPP